MNINIRDTTEGPIYLQVRQQIEAQIRDKQLNAGASLPAPAILAQQLSVDKGEVQRAYFELEQAGMIEKKSSKDFLGKAKTVYTVR